MLGRLDAEQLFEYAVQGLEFNDDILILRRRCSALHECGPDLVDEARDGENVSCANESVFSENAVLA